MTSRVNRTERGELPGLHVIFLSSNTREACWVRWVVRWISSRNKHIAIIYSYSLIWFIVVTGSNEWAQAELSSLSGRSFYCLSNRTKILKLQQRFFQSHLFGWSPLVLDLPGPFSPGVLFSLPHKSRHMSATLPDWPECWHLLALRSNPPSQSGALATCPYSPCKSDVARPPKIVFIHYSSNGNGFEDTCHPIVWLAFFWLEKFISKKLHKQTQ